MKPNNRNRGRIYIPAYKVRPPKVNAGVKNHLFLIVTLAAAVAWIYAAYLAWDAFRYIPGMNL